jgi:hypothetical protein
VAAILLVGALACLAPQPRRTLGLSVSNQLGRSIAEIRRKPCGDLELAFKPIDASRVPSGETRGFLLPPTCVDLIAYDERGRLVGEQRGLRMVPGASWVLRR